MAQGKQPSRIPTHRSVEEEAAFWDTHSAEEFADELEVVTDVRFTQAPPQPAIRVHLEEHALAALIERAKVRGVDPANLAKAWIIERLAEPEQPATSKAS